MLAQEIITGRHGKFFIQDDAFIGKSLARYGQYSEGEVELFRAFIGRDDLVLDVGANIGAFTIALASIAERVIAIEAQPDNAELLRRNVNLNMLPNVELIIAAAGARSGETTIQPLWSIGNHNYGCAEVGYPGGHRVPMKTIDDIMAFDKRVDFIKIDIEGSEHEALLGARKTIEMYHPVLYVECDRENKAGALMALLRGYGYRLFWHRPRLFDADNFANQPINVFGDIISQNLLCLPASKPLPLPTLKYPLVAVDEEVAKPAVAMPAKWAGVCRLGGVGDNLIAASVLLPLKRQGYMVEVIAADPHHVVFENNPSIDKLSVKVPTRDLPQDSLLKWQQWFASRASEYDRFAHLSHSCEGLVALFPAQTAFYWPAAFRRSLCDRNYLEVVHDIAGVPYEFGKLFFPTIDEKENARATKAKLGERVIGWCLSGTRIDKVYPFSAMAIARLIRELDIAVVMMGKPGTKDFSMAESIMDHVTRQNGSNAGLHLALSPMVETLAGDDGTHVKVEQPKPTWPLRRILSFAGVCDLVIGPDTGPMWAVAFEQMPKIVLLGHASPTNITKHWINTVTMTADRSRVPCWPCHRLHDDPSTCVPNKENLAAACMSDISVEALVAAASKLLRV